MTIRMQPTRTRKGVPFTVLVQVLDPAGNAVPNASVHGTLNMSTSDRERQDVEFSNAGGGLYRAQAKASIPGAWEVLLTAKRGSDRVQQYTPFQVEP